MTNENAHRVWFDEYGNFLSTFPADCIADCSAQGQVSEAVAYWLIVLNFRVPRILAIAYLRDFGTWPLKTDGYDQGLADMSDIELASKVLWIACCDLREQGEWLGLVR